MQHSIRAAKAKEVQLRAEGLGGARAGKIAAALVSGVKSKKAKGSRTRAADAKKAAGAASGGSN